MFAAFIVGIYGVNDGDFWGVVFDELALLYVVIFAAVVGEHVVGFGAWGGLDDDAMLWDVFGHIDIVFEGVGPHGGADHVHGTFTADDLDAALDLAGSAGLGEHEQENERDEGQGNQAFQATTPAATVAPHEDEAYRKTKNKPTQDVAVGLTPEI